MISEFTTVFMDERTQVRKEHLIVQSLGEGNVGRKFKFLQCQDPEGEGWEWLLPVWLLQPQERGLTRVHAICDSVSHWAAWW